MLQDQSQFSMKRYYEALDVPQSATLEQIRAQYKQLVRVYHPDRFADADAKAQAEERFKAINEAYRALTEVVEPRGKQPGGPKPKPVVDKDILDFGVLQRGDKRVISFQANNVGDPAVNVNYRFSSTAPWFKIAEIHPLQPDQPIPLLFKVETTLEELAEVGDYSGLIEINMDGQIAFVHLRLKLAEQPVGWQFPKRQFSYIAAGLLLFIGVVSFALFGNLIPEVLGVPVKQASATNPDRPESSVAVENVAFNPTVLRTTPAPVNQAETSTDSDWSPIFSPDGGQIAFLSNELGAPQVYVRDPQSGKLRQLTRTPEQKTKLLWSPDSSKLAYIASYRETTKIHVIDVAQSQVQELAPVALPGIVEHFVWTSDSQSIIFDYYIGQERRFYQGSFEDKESVLFTPPADWDDSWASASD